MCSMKMFTLCRSPNEFCAYRHPGRVIARCLFGKSKADKLERRKKLWAEIDKGYFADLHELRRNHGKRMEASDRLSSKGESVVFPQLSAKTLSGDSVSLPSPHVSLVLVSMRGLGMSMCDQYRKPFEEMFIPHPDVRVYELSVLDRGLFRILRGWMERNLRKNLDKLRHGSFMVYDGEGISVDELKQSLAIGNTIVGHVYLLDNRGLIRWRAHASPTEKELDTLMKFTRQLIENSSNKTSR